MELEVVKFIKEHGGDEKLSPNGYNSEDRWDKLLPKGYNVVVKRLDDMVLLDYLPGADFTNPIVCECRGLILEDKTWKVLRMAFKKFGNYGEPYVPEIDWTSARVQTKVDGSLISLFCHNNEWKVATNGTINAFNAPINSVSNLSTGFYNGSFGTLFMQALQNYVPKEKLKEFFNNLNRDYTYTFELVSPYNKIVIDYDKPDIYHIGTRDNTTCQELVTDIGIPKPKEWALYSLEDCIEVAKAFKGEQEGFVVVDKNWNRIKVKSPEYILRHRILGSKNSLKDLVNVYFDKEESEFLNYFPEHTEYFTLFRQLMYQIESECLLEISRQKILKSTFAEIAEDIKMRDIGYLQKFIFRKIRDPKSEFLDFVKSSPTFKNYFIERVKQILTEGQS